MSNSRRDDSDDNRINHLKKRRFEGVAGFDGRPAAVSFYRRGQSRYVRVHLQDSITPEARDLIPPKLHDEFSELRRSRSKFLSQCRLSGFAGKDMSLIEEIVSGEFLSLSDWARRNGCSRQAAWERLQRLLNYLPLLRLAWRRIRNR